MVTLLTGSTGQNQVLSLELRRLCENVARVGQEGLTAIAAA